MVEEYSTTDNLRQEGYMDTVRIRIRVEGTVQGVGFRYAMRAEAKRLGLSGFTRNEPDGSVSVEVEGAEGDVSVFRERAETGPSRAEVSRLESVSIPPTGERGFHIG